MPVFLRLYSAFFILFGILFTHIGVSFAEEGYEECPDGYDLEAIRLVNIIRQEARLKPLIPHEGLMKSSSMRAKAMVLTINLTHAGWKESIHKVGYGKYAIGENIARGYGTPALVVKGWYFSAGHRENLLDPNYTHIGIGCYQDSAGSLWWAQHFGGS